MYKWMYNRIVDEYSKQESKEELVQRILSLSEIECQDRSFANQCQAGTDIYNINELFAAINDIKSGFTYEKLDSLYEVANKAKGSWNFITNELANMNNNYRCDDFLNNFRERVRKAINTNDSI